VYDTPLLCGQERVVAVGVAVETVELVLVIVGAVEIEELMLDGPAILIAPQTFPLLLAAPTKFFI
jgi:hypothetical protein